MPIRIPLICQVNGGGSSSPAFAVADDVQSEACDGEGSQQPKGVHVPQDVDLAVHQHQHSDGNADSESNRPVWRPAEPIALEDKFGEELHARESQKDVVGSNDGGIAGERQDETGADRHLGLQEDIAPMPTQQGDQLRGQDGISRLVLLQESREQRQQGAGRPNGDDDEEERHADDLLARSLHRGREL